MKQEERRQQTIRLLLTTTAALIQEKGCSAITMKDIMDRSGLSKGAIFHYVESKDDIFAWILQERLEETNARFMEAVNEEHKSFEEPMRRIAESLPALADARDVTNQVLMYLLGKEDQPRVAQVLERYYGSTLAFSKAWIDSGRQHGVIPASVDAAKTSELFVLLSLGLRVRASLTASAADTSEPPAFGAQDFAAFISRLLQP